MPATSHIAVWTGSEMVVWGGYGAAGYLNTGRRYNPVNNLWSGVAIPGAPAGRSSPTAVWNGSEMIVWGGYGGSGYQNTGGRYNPASNLWTIVSTSGAPSERHSQSGVWTGTEMLVWGGVGPSGPEIRSVTDLDAAGTTKFYRIEITKP